MPKCALPFIAALLGLATCQAEDIPLMRIADIYENTPPHASVIQIRGSVVSGASVRSDRPPRYTVRDDTGGIMLKNFSTTPCEVGDLICATGRVSNLNPGTPWFVTRSLAVIGHEDPTKPIPADPAGLARGEYNFLPVTLAGVITEVMSDDVGREYAWFVLDILDTKTPIAVRVTPSELAELETLIDAKVSITGLASPDHNFRRFSRPYVNIRSVDSIRILEPPRTDPFSAEEFRFASTDFGNEIPRFPHRRRISGRMIASWRDKYMFVNTGQNRNVLVRLRKEGPMPPADSLVTAVGFLSKTTFYARLDNALVRKDADPGSAVETPTDISARETLSDGNAKTRINPDLNGKLVRVRGTAHTVYRAGAPDARMDLECDGFVVPVEIGHCTPPAPGSVAEITGAFIMETESEYEGLGFSRIRGFSVAPRGQSDIRIIAAPPWWTPGKFLTVIGVLFLVIGAILVWNVSLKRVSDRKSRELLEEKSARLKSQLRIDERTKLAVELHDSLAQNLTGISLQLDAAEMAEAEDRTAAVAHLANAREALRSCREGLRYCLSDLRSRSFEDSDMTEAVTETVRPHIGKTRLSVRFHVPRAKLSDTTAHAVLCIVRELAVNAVRHGHATDIRIAGEFKDGQIRFSVRDNGCGFDPSTCPGSAQGHFGLLGVNERVSNFKGSLKIDSAIAKGTKATVILNIT